MPHPEGVLGFRGVTVPLSGDGMRLDRFLAGFFVDRSRSWLRRGIDDGLVRDPGERSLRASHRVRAGDELRLYLPEIAPSDGPPAFPDVLHEDDRLIAVDKPAGLITHPAGSTFVWALITLAKQRWPDDRIDLVHRLDRDTSGVIFLTRDLEANRQLKLALKEGRATKEYIALCRGRAPFRQAVLDGPIGYRGEVIRIQMAVRDDGLPARTDVTVMEQGERLAKVHCRLHTGRTHQIRVHLAHAGLPILGDRLYGVPPEVFLDTLDHGVTEATIAATGAPRHALHAHRTTLPHPDGGEITVEAPLPPDMQQWWAEQ
jgi:23S rRNA pseudouridine1911/1915/1917 synthase